MLFQAVYVSKDGDSFDTLVGVGVSGDSSMVNPQSKLGFSSGDRHYANGTYDGPMTHEVVIDERTAALYNVTTGDTLYIGGTLRIARQHEYRIVGVRSTFGTFLGTATVTIHQSELQRLTGTTGTDPASLITVATASGTPTTAVETALEEEYPSYSVRTNREQLEAILGRQSAVMAGLVSIVTIAVIAGVALVMNVLGLLVYHQRQELAALKATGVSAKTLFAVVGGQGIVIGLLGGALGVLIAPGITAGLNPVIANLSGFTELIKLPWWILGAGGGLAFLTGLIGAVFAGWRIHHTPSESSSDSLPSLGMSASRLPAGHQIIGRVESSPVETIGRGHHRPLSSRQ